MLNEIYAFIIYSATLSNSQEGKEPYKNPITVPISIDNKFTTKEEFFRVPAPRTVRPNYIPRLSPPKYLNSAKYSISHNKKRSYNHIEPN